MDVSLFFTPFVAYCLGNTVYSDAVWTSDRPPAVGGPYPLPDSQNLAPAFCGSNFAILDAARFLAPAGLAVAARGVLACAAAFLEGAIHGPLATL